MNRELSILIEIMEKKKYLLESILADTKEQLKLVDAEEFHEESFDALMDHKSELLDEINKSDDVFDSVFKPIQTELIDKKEMYAEQIGRMQDFIKEILDLGSDIRQSEQIVKNKLTDVLLQKRQQLQKEKADSKAVMSYYKQASQSTYMNSLFLDQKK